MDRDNLYHVKDCDRPMWVVAKSWEEALKKWEHHIAFENDIEEDDVESCLGIDFVCDHTDLIV